MIGAFSEFILAANVWVSSRKELLAVLGVPLLTLMVTHLSATRAEKRNRVQQEIERKLAQELKLVDFRQAWINDLRTELADFVALASMAEKDFNEWEKLTAKLGKIKLMLNPDDSEAEELLLQCGALVKTMCEDVDSNTKIGDQVLVLSQRLLKKEWDRLKRDLSKVEDPQ